MRAKLGESLSTIQKPGRSFDEVTTTSLDALKAFYLGYDLLSRDSPRDAIPQFQRACHKSAPSRVLATWTRHAKALLK